MWRPFLPRTALFVHGKNRRHFSSPAPFFSKVLVANRGEIAQRVMRTCRRLGIPTVAVYSTADAMAPFVELADEAVCIGTSPTCYLDIDCIVKAIQDTGSDAVHPGYGFLSENAGFPRAIHNLQGVQFLGPSANAMEKLGDKLESKRLAEHAGVSVIPGHGEELESLEQALDLCQSTVPYPVLLKAAAGGGGKGMRVCRSDRELKEAWTVDKAEALKFFNDDRLLLEKFVEEPHHIEFQVIAADNDQSGKVDVVVFPERECSIQRRNQKILEESPSVLLTNETRNKMASQVRALCQTVNYESAGTVEFLVDENQQFYFLEMNTRLQVEHPVVRKEKQSHRLVYLTSAKHLQTEAITGVDLVEAMLSVGSGRGLPESLRSYTEEIVPYTGHAVEARIYAEDPIRGFLPSTGPLSQYLEPEHAPFPYPRDPPYIRLDSGVEPGYTVTPHYDPMISKLIAYGVDRHDSISRLRHALDSYVIEGVQHNCRLVQSVLRQPGFVEGHTPTSFLTAHYPDQFSGVQLEAFEMEELAVAAVVISDARQVRFERPPLVSASSEVIIRLGGQFGVAYQVTFGDTESTVRKLSVESGEAISEPRLVRFSEFEYHPINYQASLSLDGSRRTIQVLSEEITGELVLQMFGHKTSVLVQSPLEFELSRLYMQEPPAVDTSSLIQSPMPGLLVSYAVEPGDTVEEGQELCIVESMKMQNMIRSPRNGIIATCDCESGASVRVDQTILTFQVDD